MEPNFEVGQSSVARRPVESGPRGHERSVQIGLQERRHLRLNGQKVYSRCLCTYEKKFGPSCVARHPVDIQYVESGLDSKNAVTF